MAWNPNIFCKYCVFTARIRLCNQALWSSGMIPPSGDMYIKSYGNKPCVGEAPISIIGKAPFFFAVPFVVRIEVGARFRGGFFWFFA